MWKQLGQFLGFTANAVGAPPGQRSGLTGLEPAVRESILEKVPKELEWDFLRFIDYGEISDKLGKAMDTQKPLQEAVEIAFKAQSREFEQFAQALRNGATSPAVKTAVAIGTLEPATAKT